MSPKPFFSPEMILYTIIRALALVYRRDAEAKETRV
jgi:hypothetical protein